MIDVLIIDSPATGMPKALEDALQAGYKIMHVVPFEYFYNETQTRYPQDGGPSYQVEIRKGQCPYVKYVLERDGIARKLFA